jgi:predicted dehydrogenase
MNRIRLGLIGAGFSAHIHISAYREYSHLFDIVGVCAGKVEHAKDFAEKFGIKRVYENYKELLEDKDIDAVDICVPTNLHAEVIIDSAKAKKHIICEKPLTGYFGEDTNEEEVGKISKRHMFGKVIEKVNEIEKAIKENSVKFLYAENFVYSPVVTKIKRLISASKGHIIEIRAEESHSGSHASYSRRWKTAGGGSLLRMGSHPVGLVLHLKSYEGKLKYGKPIKPLFVIGEVGNLTKIPDVQKEEKHYMFSNWYDVEDWSCLIITFEDGSKGIVFSSDTSLGGVKNLVQVFTSRGVLYGNITPNNTILAYAPEHEIWGDEYIAEKIETKAGWTFPTPDEDWIRGYPQEIKDFAECIINDKEPLSDFELAKDTVKVIYAGYISSEEGVRIKIE